MKPDEANERQRTSGHVSRCEMIRQHRGTMQVPPKIDTPQYQHTSINVEFDDDKIILRKLLQQHSQGIHLAIRIRLDSHIDPMILGQELGRHHFKDLGRFLLCNFKRIDMIKLKAKLGIRLQNIHGRCDFVTMKLQSAHVNKDGSGKGSQLPTHGGPIVNHVCHGIQVGALVKAKVGMPKRWNEWLGLAKGSMRYLLAFGKDSRNVKVQSGT